MGNGPTIEYETQMGYLIREYKSLRFEDRKYRFTEFVRREADIFARAIDNGNIGNITKNDFDYLMRRRTDYLHQLFDNKDVCTIF